MGFTEVLAVMQRVLPKRRQQNTFEALEADEDDDESWRGSMGTSTEDWNRIQEGQRMLQLSTSLWFGTDQGPFDMKDHERYELLYGRPIGVEDPMLEALRMQRHHIQGGIYVEPVAYARESSGFTPYTSTDGLLPTHDADGDVDKLPQRRGAAARDSWPAPSQAMESADAHPADSESRRLTHLASFQRRLQPSMSWQYRMTRFRCSECSEDAAEAGSSSNPNTMHPAPTRHWDKPCHAAQPTGRPAPQGSKAQDSCGAAASAARASDSPADAMASLHADEVERLPASPAVAIPSPHPAAENQPIPQEHEDDHIHHMAWKWRFTKRWCKEQDEPHAEPSRRDAAFVEALAGAPSGAWSHLLRRTSTEAGLGERDPNTLTESFLFSDGGEDTGAAALAGGPRWQHHGPLRTSLDSRAGSCLGAVQERGRFEGRIRGGAAL